MPGIFDGLAGALNAVFGAPVTHIDAAGQSRTVQAVLRRLPVEVAEENGGGIWITAPTLRLPAPDAALILRGDRIEADGYCYRVLNRIATKSPATDRFVVFELEDLAP